ncbi:hypothetical protein P3T23_004726 [Paraburkholderia sp. GAS448]|uniref:hypothetical protein n=1 Tax=Paraburkholderia sp. GAS448 TaxID=3035136 RepID=UPI003D24D5B0
MTGKAERAQYTLEFKLERCVATIGLLFRVLQMRRPKCALKILATPSEQQGWC